MKIKKSSKIFSNDFYYDLFVGGCLKPEKLCIDLEQAKKIRKAIDLLKGYKQSLVKAGVLHDESDFDCDDDEIADTITMMTIKTHGDNKNE